MLSRVTRLDESSSSSSTSPPISEAKWNHAKTQLVRHTHSLLLNLICFLSLPLSSCLSVCLWVLCVCLWCFKCLWMSHFWPFLFVAPFMVTSHFFFYFLCAFLRCLLACFSFFLLFHSLYLCLCPRSSCFIVCSFVLVCTFSSESEYFVCWF